MAGGLYLIGPGEPGILFAHPSLLLAWPTVPVGVWLLGRALTHKSQQPEGGPLSELAGFAFRTAGVGVLFAPTLVGNAVLAVPVPAAWIYAAGVFGGWRPESVEVQIARFALLLFCGLSLVFHLILDHYRARRRQTTAP
jgi:hypothetical protein